MQRIIAAVLASSLFVPTVSLAQDGAVNRQLRINRDDTLRSRPIFDAAIREARSAIAAGEGLQQARPQRSFPSRHPVVTGTLIGAGSGFAVGALLNQTCSDSSEPGLCSMEAYWLSTLVGAGVGAIIGRVISRQ